VIDGRNIFDAEAVVAEDFVYFGIGRKREPAMPSPERIEGMIPL
jgi:hypothetical protein